MASDLYYHVALKAGPVAYDLSHDLTAFTIEEEGGKPDQLIIDISDPYKIFSHALQEGVELEVDLGRVEEHALIFRGHIYRVEGDLPKDGVPKLKVIAYDASIKMGLRRRNRVHEGGMKTIVADIAGGYSDDFDMQSHSIKLENEPRFEGNGIRQQNETDLAFLRRLASAYGCELYVDPAQTKSRLHFESQAHIMSTKPIARIAYGRCAATDRLISFKPQVDVSNIELARRYSGIDYKTGAAIEQKEDEQAKGIAMDDEAFDENLATFSKAYPLKAGALSALIGVAKDNEQLQKNLRQELGGAVSEATPCFTTARDLNVRAKNRAYTSLNGMRASGTSAGNYKIHAQATLDVFGAGGRFSGIWYLSKVRHSLNAQGYQTEFECQR